MKDSLSFYIQKYISDYLPNIRNMSSNTISTYSYGILIFIEFIKSKDLKIDTMTIEDLNYELIEEYIKWLIDTKKNSSSTANARIACIKSFVNFLSTRNLNNFDSCMKIKNIKPLKVKKKAPEYLTEKEISILLKSIKIKSFKDLKHLAILTLLYDAALRVSELCDLKIKDVSIDKNQMKIMIFKSKNGLPRTISISKPAEKIMKKYLNQLNDSSNNQEDYLFKNKYDNKYSRNGIYSILNNKYEKAKQQCNDNTLFNVTIHPHILRHSKATHLLNVEVDLLVIKDFLGHKSLKATEIYLHISDRKKSEILINNAKLKLPKTSRTKKVEKDLEHWLKSNLDKLK